MARKREDGFILIVVLFALLFLSAMVATVHRRALLDRSIVTHRDDARAAEALARGGLRLAETLLLEDLLEKSEAPRPESLHDIWARAVDTEIVDDPELSLDLEIEDLGGRYPLNAIVSADDSQRVAWRDLLDVVIDDMPGRPEDKLYETDEMVANLIDWVDEDDVSETGQSELDRYARSDPPIVPSNGPLLSIDELRLVEGFDGPLVEALAPYVSVFPLKAEWGINLNTAPPWVCARLQLLDSAEGIGRRFVDDDWARDLIETRGEALICEEQEGECFRPDELGVIGSGDRIDPPHRGRSNVFRVRARARANQIERTLTAVVDRGQGAALVRLAWRMR